MADHEYLSGIESADLNIANAWAANANEKPLEAIDIFGDNAWASIVNDDPLDVFLKKIHPDIPLVSTNQIVADFLQSVPPELMPQDDPPQLVASPQETPNNEAVAKSGESFLPDSMSQADNTPQETHQLQRPEPVQPQNGQEQNNTYNYNDTYNYNTCNKNPAYKNKPKAHYHNIRPFSQGANQNQPGAHLPCEYITPPQAEIDSESEPVTVAPAILEPSQAPRITKHPPTKAVYRVQKLAAPSKSSKKKELVNKSRRLQAMTPPYSLPQSYKALTSVPQNWGCFSYNRFGELEPGRTYSVDQIEQFLCKNRQYPHEFKPLANDSLTLWIQRTPPDNAIRCGEPHTSHCRFEDCRFGKEIRAGEVRVAMDELTMTNPTHDPQHNAGYVHLACLEMHTNFPKTVWLLNVKAEDRVLPLEVTKKNYMILKNIGELENVEMFLRFCKRENRPPRSYSKTKLIKELLQVKEVKVSANSQEIWLRRGRAAAVEERELKQRQKDKAQYQKDKARYERELKERKSKRSHALPEESEEPRASSMPEPESGASEDKHERAPKSKVRRAKRMGQVRVVRHLQPEPKYQNKNRQVDTRPEKPEDRRIRPRGQLRAVQYPQPEPKYQAESIEDEDEYRRPEKPEDRRTRPRGQVRTVQYSQPEPEYGIESRNNDRRPEKPNARRAKRMGQVRTVVQHPGQCPEPDSNQVHEFDGRRNTKRFPHTPAIHDAEYYTRQLVEQRARIATDNGMTYHKPGPGLGEQQLEYRKRLARQFEDDEEEGEEYHYSISTE